MLKYLKERLEKLEPKKLLLYVIAVVIGGGLLGYVLRQLIRGGLNVAMGGKFRLEPLLLVMPSTWLMGYGTLFVFWVMLWFWPMVFNSKGAGKGLLGNRGRDSVVDDSVLENSRFLTNKERDTFFPATTYEQLQKVKKDGVPVRALLDRKGKLEINFLSGTHSLVIGSTVPVKPQRLLTP